MPFLNHAAWISAQHDCTQLRSTFTHLSQGTHPPRKARNMKDLRRYLRVASINGRGLLVVRKPEPFLHQRELIIVPSAVLPGILSALHIYIFFMHFCPGTITTHAESINSDLQRGLDRRLRHIQH